MTRHRWLVAAASAALVSLGCWIVIGEGASDEQALAETRLDEVSQREVLVRARLRAADEFAAGGEASRAELAALVAAVPGDTDLAGFVAAHDAMATDAGVRVETLTPDDPDAERATAPPGTVAVGVEVHVDGPASAVRAYQEGLQQLDRVAAVDEVELTSEGSDLVSLRVRFRIFATT